MRRRRFIAASSLAAATAATAGCIEAFGGEGSEPEDDQGERDTDVEEFDVELRHPGVVVDTAYSFSTERNDADEVEEIDDGVRSHVEAAVEDGVTEVDDPSSELLNMLQSTRYVLHDDRVYELEHSLPEYVVTGEESDLAPDDVSEDDVVGMHEDVIRVVGTDNRQISRLANDVVELDGRRGYVGTGEFRTPTLQPRTEEFLEDTEYIGVSTSEDPTAVDVLVLLHVTEDDPDEPYTITATELSHEELYDVEEARELDELDERHQEVFLEAVEGQYRGESLPEGFREAVEDVHYLVDGEAHQAQILEPDYDDVPVELEVEVEDRGQGESHQPPSEEDLERYRERFEEAHEEDDDEKIEELTDELWSLYRPSEPASFRLQLTNTGEETVQVFSGAPAPYGVLRVDDPEAPGGSRLLWSESYRESGHVNVGPHGLAVHSIGLTTELEPGETLAETYEAAYPEGTYQVQDSITIERRRGDDVTLPYTVDIKVP